MRFLSRPAFLTFPLLSLSALFSVLLPLIMLSPVARAQQGPLDKSAPQGITVEEIIKRFATKEKEFKEARDQYTYRQDVKVMTLDGDTPDGAYQQVFDVTFDDKGRKTKNVVFAPQPTLQRILMTEEDFDDIENRLPFVLTSDEVGEYDILYVGQQKQDELNTYVFDIAPKQIVGKKRYFQGRIWVDNHDFQIVETYGKTVPDIRKKKGNENLFPKFTTWREQIDGQYWFPTYTRAEDTLQFSLGGVKIREIIKYTNYRRFGSKSRVTYEGQEVQKAEPKPGDQKPPEPPKPQ
ncbi:MAG TPA: hypothetical protein VK395_23305 [Gemmataceae bacterium]|nr:hypothetical protein [Terriglobales bacterium]HLN30688.1 hypothetical protein [Gemmataceae bacterium]